MVVIVQFKDGKLASERIHWDQASVLVQLGLLDPGQTSRRRSRDRPEGARSRITVQRIDETDPQGRGAVGISAVGTPPLLWGFCQEGSALSCFCRCGRVWGVDLFVSPERLPRRAVRGFGGAEPPIKCGWVFFFGAFPLRLPRRVLLGQSAIRKRAQKDRHLHHDLFGSGRGTSTLNLQIEFLVALSGGVEGAPFQRVFFGGRERFSARGKGPP
jgi:hypothetical protein